MNRGGARAFERWTGVAGTESPWTAIRLQLVLIRRLALRLPGSPRSGSGQALARHCHPRADLRRCPRSGSAGSSATSPLSTSAGRSCSGSGNPWESVSGFGGAWSEAPGCAMGSVDGSVGRFVIAQSSAESVGWISGSPCGSPGSLAGSSGATPGVSGWVRAGLGSPEGTTSGSWTGSFGVVVMLRPVPAGQKCTPADRTEARAGHPESRPLLEAWVGRPLLGGYNDWDQKGNRSCRASQPT